MEQKSAEQSPDIAPKSRRTLILVLVGIAIAIVLYVIGFVNGRSQVGDLRTQLDAAQENLAKVTEQRDVALARSLLYRTAADLEERNFGKAQERLSEAATILSTLAPGGGVGGDGIRAVQKQVEETRIDVSTNVETQRSAVLEMAKRLDSLQPR
ncbi:MAG: hypothetical protein HRF45_07145 [Fimbriimonadia bacterium]|jgi:uncharacterized protein HemX